MFVVVVLCVDNVQGPGLHLDRDPDVGLERVQPGGGLPQVHPQAGLPQNSAEGGCRRAHRGHGEDALLLRRRVLEVHLVLLSAVASFMSEFQVERENCL